MSDVATVVSAAPTQLSDNNATWVEVMPARVYHTTEYGDVPIPVDKLERFITNFHQNVRGQEIATDFDHGLDPAKGREASGWYRDFKIDTSSASPNEQSLYAQIEFTEDAKKAINDKKYKYWSLEWDDEYITDDLNLVQDVIIGGGLTNRPVAKRTMPIAFSETWSELDDGTKKAIRLLRERGYGVVSSRQASEAAIEHSDPGIGAPLYASALEQPDPGFGQFVPRVTGDPAKDDLSIASGSRRDPLPVLPPGETTDPITVQESRQSSGDEPVPNLFSEGGNKKVSDATVLKFTEEAQGAAVVNELVKLLGFDGDDPEKFVEEARKQFGELKTFRDTVGQSQQERKFSEQFPDVWAQHQRLISDGRNAAAKTFAESVSRLNRVAGKNDDETPKYEPTRNGLSGLALESIAEAHKKFSEGTATLEDFEDVVKTITNGGIVEFGEVGSNLEPDQPVADTSTAQGRANARKVFAEKVGEVQAKYAKDNDGKQLDVLEATAKASEIYPELAAAYQATA